MDRYMKKESWMMGLLVLALTSACAAFNMLFPEKGSQPLRTEPLVEGDPYISPNPALMRDFLIGSHGYIFREEWGEAEPAWSPDGEWLVFVSNRDGDADIYLVRKDGTGLRNLTPDPSPALATFLFLLDKTVDNWPDWDPTGDQIYFASARTNIMMQSTPLDIYRMAGDGSSVVQLTDTVDMEGLPDVSPDGEQILFVSDRDDAIDIFLIDSDGTETTQLTTEGDDNDMPDWSPNGDLILYQAVIEENQEIFLMDPDGTNLIRLTNDPGMDTQPVWSPDGSQIVFVSDRDGDEELYLMNADGNDLVQLTDNGVFDSDPAWSPHGDFIAYRSTTVDGARIFLLDLETGEIEPLFGEEITQPPQENAVYHLHRGLALYRQLLIDDIGDYDQVIEAFSLALELDPSLGEAYLGRGMARLNQCEIYWMHAVGSELTMVEEKEDCQTFDAAVADIEKAQELGLAPALTLGVENFLQLLR